MIIAFHGFDPSYIPKLGLWVLGAAATLMALVWALKKWNEDADE
jgi:hypothetical protein